MKKRSLEKILRKKMQTKLDPSFEENFWEKFHQENPKKKSSFNKKIFIPALSFALLLIVCIPYFKKEQFEPQTLQIVYHEQLLEDLDFFLEVNDEMLAYTDEEWDILLEEDS